MKINVQIIVMFTGIIFFNSCIFFDLYKETQQLKEMKIENIDVSKVKDGEYYGECTLAVKSAKVDVTVSNGVITKIEILTHDYGPGHNAEKITDRILEKQSLDVDVVSGSTKSSLVLKKAVEDALSKGL